MKIRILTVVGLLISSGVIAQNSNKEVKNFFWTFHTQNTVVNGLSAGIFSGFGVKERKVTTNGIRLEIPGLGLLMPIANGTEITNIKTVSGKLKASEYIFDETVNGINISSGSIGDLKFNGVTLGLIGQYGVLSNGVSASLVMNSMNKTNGLQASGLLNENLYTNGIQVSLGNVSVLMNGIQIGGRNYIYQSGYGIQIGVVNEAKGFKGLQFGIWNENNKRSLPLINWNFKS